MRRALVASVLSLTAATACRRVLRPTLPAVYVARETKEVNGCTLLQYLEVPFARGGEAAARDTLVARVRVLQGNVLLPLGVDRFVSGGVAPDPHDPGSLLPAIGRDRGAAYRCPDL